MDNNIIREREMESEPINNSSVVDSNTEQTKTVDTDFITGLILIGLVIGAVWFFFFRIPSNLTTKMLETDNAVEELTEKKIIRELENSGLTFYLEYIEDIDIEKWLVDVSIPTIVKENPEDYQTGDRYKVEGGYAFPVELPLKLHLTCQSSNGDNDLYPIDITVSGSIVYLTGETKGHISFRGIKVEYEDNFMDLLNISDTMSYLDGF